jgi:HlyD family type I secretion membrane fusion protein
MSLQLANPSKLPVVRRRTDMVGDVIGAFESDTIAVFRRTAPIHEHIILYVMSAMVVLAVALAAVVKLDRVVTSQAGFIAPTAGSLYVSPLNASVVRTVNVKAGEVVKKGEALATLDPTFTHADLVQLQQHFDSDQAAVNREEAELAGHPYEFSSANTYQATQGGLWLKREAQYHSDLASLDGQIHSAEAQMTQAQSDAEKYQKRLKLAAETENVYQPLLEKGYVSKLQVMTSTDARTEMSRLLADAENQISQYRETAASLKAQRESYIHKWYSDTSTQLVLDRNDLDLTRDSLAKAQKLQELTSLDAPADAIVLKVGKLSPGSVAAGSGTDSITIGSDPLFTLTPLGAPVEAELDISTIDIGFIAVGDPVQVKLDAYPFLRHGMAKGVVRSISEGSFSVDANNTPVSPYFKVRVAIKDVHLRNVPAGFRLIPGMTIAGDIMVGRRTILSYLVEGALRTGSEAMREP